MTSTNKSLSFFLRFSGLVFVFFMLILAYIYDFHHIIFLEPQSVHMWRQSDCLSFALNYQMENRSFFDPAINFIGECGTGQTISDFPLIYYIVGKLWQITGQHEFIYRGIVLLLFFTGLFFLYRMLVKIFNDRFWAMIVPLLLFSSPVLSYYSNNFLMEIPSLSLVLIGWYFFFKFYQTSENKWLWITMIIFALAGLLKVSSLFSYFAILGIFIFEWLNLFSFRLSKPVFPAPKKAIYPLVFVLFVIAAWFVFVTRFINTHNRDFFLVGILPIWEMSLDEIKVKFLEIATHWIFFNFPGYFQLLVVVFWFIMLVLPKKNKPIFYYLNIVLAIGAILYLMLFFQVVAGHDYYWINLYIVLIVTITSFIFFLKKNFQPGYKWGKIIFAILLFFNVIYSKNMLHERYHGEYMEYYNLYIKDFKSMKDYNRKLGIRREDFVISIPEGTINTSLYLMDQKGWSAYGTNFEREEFFRTDISMGAKYLFVSDSTLLRKDYLKPFIKNKIGQYKSISVFDLRNIEP